VNNSRASYRSALSFSLALFCATYNASELQVAW
jgi:hypothetical protein